MAERMDPIAEIRERLRKYPHARAEEGPGRIVVRSADESGFDVALAARGRSYVVSFGGWHEEFSSPEEALNCLALGLSERCRLKVHQRGETEYRWTLEYHDNGSWKAESTTGLLLFPFWRARKVRYRQNHLLPAGH